MHSPNILSMSGLLARHRKAFRVSWIPGGACSCSSLATNKEHMGSTKLVDSSDNLQTPMEVSGVLISTGQIAGHCGSRQFSLLE